MNKAKDKTESNIPSINIADECEHTEFHNAYTVNSIKNDIAFLEVVYGEKAKYSENDVNTELIILLKGLGKEIYFFILSLGTDLTPQVYIKLKYEFIQSKIPDGCQQLFYLAWNGLIINDSFKKILRQKFNLAPFSEVITPNNIPFMGSTNKRYRNKMVLADDMAKTPEGNRRVEGRELNDGSGLKMRERIVWFPNGKAMPIFPQAYVPLNQSQVILIRHGKSEQESGGDNPKFVGSGYKDSWYDNRRVSGSMGNHLKPEGIETAKDLGRNFKVASDILAKEGHPLWSWSKDNPIKVFGSESENTEQTARYFLQEAGYSNLSFNAIYGLNSQKYGALTHRLKNEVFAETVRVSKRNLGKTDEEKLKNVKAEFKNRFYHYPEGETLIEADWRIAFSFVDLLKKNQGKRILLADHSGAIRVFAAIIKNLDFADYASLKENQNSIIVLSYSPGKNVRYDYLQHSDFPLQSKI